MALPAVPFRDMFDLISAASKEIREGQPKVRIAATANLPTRFGEFTIYAFENDFDRKEHIAVVRGDVHGRENIPVRLHSECLTGDVLGSYRCDCRDQLEAGLKHIGDQEQGILLYLRQEGRGIGLTNKIRAYALQDLGLDTVEANHALGFRDDERDYTVAAEMLRTLGVKSIELFTNNPRKIQGLQENGIEITKRVPHVQPVHHYNRHYLETKVRKSGHLIELDALSLAAK